MGNSGSASKQTTEEQAIPRKGIYKTDAKQIIFGFGGENYGQLLNKADKNLAILDLNENRRIVGNDDESVSEISCGSYHTVVRATSGRTFGFGWSDYGWITKKNLLTFVRSIRSCRNSSRRHSRMCVSQTSNQSDHQIQFFHIHYR
jgi:alpha-tubulin suppressor-like RCC1 family protein